MKKYKVFVFPEPLEYEVEAENKEQAERFGHKLYNGGEGLNLRIESEEIEKE